MPLQATSGAASYDAFGGGVAAVPNYIEDVFSTYLYTGNGSTQTITNGIDLSTKGGLVWSKSRSTIDNHVLLDTIRGPNNILSSNLTAGGSTSGTPYVTASTTGYSIGTSNSQINGSGNNYASWTFRKQPKFFDVVTYTGTGVARTIAHNLGSVPGFIIVKRTDAVGAWTCFHRSLANTQFLPLNATNAAITNTAVWNSTSPTSTVFTVGTDTDVNASGGTYVAYLFAHDAGGFGLTGTDNVISCGSFVGTGTANTPTVTLGYEPQWLLIKKINGTISTSASSWTIWDTMRGIATGGNDSVLWANLSDAESTPNAIQVTSTGFQIETSGTFYNESGSTYIYIAIRRGPMKVPTSGTSIFTPYVYAGNGSGNRNFDTTLNPNDMFIAPSRRDGFQGYYTIDRLRGAAQFLSTNATSAEAAGTSITSYYQLNNNTQTSIADVNGGSNINNIDGTGINYVFWAFKRAPSFFDVVCYTGNGGSQNIAHSLTVAPELIIVKCRSAVRDWPVYSSGLGNAKVIFLDVTNASQTQVSTWNSTTPTASVFSVGADADTNTSAQTYVAYLFATCAGVSKVGSYTGNGSSQTINCGFTGGARFILIKRTDNTGNWWVWDTARGIVAANDPALTLNAAGAEVNQDAVDPDSTGFIVNQLTTTSINVTSATYIFLAIA